MVFINFTAGVNHQCIMNVATSKALKGGVYCSIYNNNHRGYYSKIHVVPLSEMCSSLEEW